MDKDAAKFIGISFPSLITDIFSWGCKYFERSTLVIFFKTAGLYLKNSWIKKPTYNLKYYDIDYNLVKDVYNVWKWNNKDTKGNDPKPNFRKEFPAKFSLIKDG